MYCPTCGAQLAQKLTYCNRCGANLRAMMSIDEAKLPEKSIDSVLWVIVGTTITILGMSLGALVLMRDGDIDRGLGSVFVILSFVALVVVEGVLVWRLLNLNKGAKETHNLAQPKYSDAERPGAVGTRALDEPVPSVTEQTTRVFEPSYKDDEQR